ncbi:Clavaminate synthase-like protein [Hypoxylon sp. NC1633]|nr:Clavaminate synthase-like protein [Hypoxylon sp. NC1633]
MTLRRKEMTDHISPLSSESVINLQGWLRSEEHGLAADIVSRQHSSIPQPPRGFPSHINDPIGWSGLDADGTQVHIFDLKSSGQAAVEECWQSLREDQELDGDEVTRDVFLLPTLQSQLDQCAFQVHRGKGLCIIRGLDPERRSVEDNTIFFLALASYVGDQRGVQNSKGDMLSHVTESKSWSVPRERRHGIHTNTSLVSSPSFLRVRRMKRKRLVPTNTPSQPFHNDMGCEILSMQIREQAIVGGRTCVASIAAIYNDLMQSNPWVLHALAKHNWPIQTSSKKGPPFVMCPLLESHDGHLLISMDPARIGPHPRARNSVIPNLTAEQQAALAILQKAAEKHQVQLDTQPGDIVFINNLGLLHARESYGDSDSSSRHLVRLWLRNTELGWAIPPSMKMPWDAVFGDGAEKVINRYYPVVPMPKYMECRYSNGTAAFVADSDEDNGDDVTTGIAS